MWLQVSKYSSESAEILLHISIANKEELKTKQTTSPNHMCVLLVADDDNKVILKKKLMSVYIDTRHRKQLGMHDNFKKFKF